MSSFFSIVTDDIGHANSRHDVILLNIIEAFRQLYSYSVFDMLLAVKAVGRREENMIAILRQREVLIAQAGKLLTLFVLVIVLIGCTTPTQNSNQDLETPSLIQLAYDRGEITEEERLLYLAYAVFDYESLPTRFQGNEGWSGESVLRDLEGAANNPAVFCSMSPYIRSEFQRLLEPETLCTQNQAHCRIWTHLL